MPRTVNSGVPRYREFSCGLHTNFKIIFFSSNSHLYAMIYEKENYDMLIIMSS